MTHVRRPVVLDDPEPAPIAPVPLPTSRYPGRKISTFIHARSRGQTDDGIPHHIGGCWSPNADDVDKVWKRARELTKGWGDVVFLRYTVTMEYAGMKVWARGEEDELWPVVRSRVEQIMDTLVLTHRHLHSPDDQIARTHEEYDAGMRGSM